MAVFAEFNLAYVNYAPLDADPPTSAILELQVNYSEPTTGTDAGIKGFTAIVNVGTLAETNAAIRAAILAQINTDNSTAYVDADLMLKNSFV